MAGMRPTGRYSVVMTTKHTIATEKTAKKIAAQAYYRFGICSRCILRVPQKLVLAGQIQSADKLDRYPVGIEGEETGDFRDRIERRLVGPHAVQPGIPQSRYAVLAGLALVRAIGAMLRARQQRHVDVTAGYILHRGVGGLR